MSSSNLEMFFESSLQSETKVAESDISIACKLMVESLCEDLLSMPRADASVRISFDIILSFLLCGLGIHAKNHAIGFRLEQTLSKNVGGPRLYIPPISPSV
jgi:hypothetical protein